MRSGTKHQAGIVKVRLHGLPEDVEAAIVELQENCHVLYVSGVYEDRNSELIRVYIEIKV